MPLDGSGNLILPPGASNAAPLTTIKSQSQHNDLWADAAAAISAKLDADGRKVITGDLVQSAGKSIRTGRDATALDEVVRLGQARTRIATISPVDYGCVPNSTAPGIAAANRSAFQAMFAAIERVTTNDFAMPMRVIDFGGNWYAIDGMINVTRAPFTRLEKGGFLAVPGAWGASDYILNCNGADAFANMGIELDVSFVCGSIADGKLANGVYLQNAFRAKTGYNFRVNKFRNVGLYIGDSVGLARFHGTLHEWEGLDGASFSNPALRTATGVWVSPGAGDIWLDVHVGWTYRCVYLQNTGGPVWLRGHLYCSSLTPPGMLGILVEIEGAGAKFMEALYADTGEILYKGGPCYLTLNIAHFHLTSPAVTPPALDYFINMQAVAAGQFHQLVLRGSFKSDRAKRLVKKTESGGNSWTNVPPDWTVPALQRDFWSAIDPTHFSLATLDANIWNWYSHSAGGAFQAFSDPTTSVPAQIGGQANNLQIYTAGIKAQEIDAAQQNVGFGIAPVTYGASFRNVAVGGKANVTLQAVSTGGVTTAAVSYATNGAIGTISNHDIQVIRNNVAVAAVTPNSFDHYGTHPPRLPLFTLATRPSAATSGACMIFVTDRPGGAGIQVSNGTTWENS